MSRARGNARKKKTRLTEQSLSAVMEVARPRTVVEGVASDGGGFVAADADTTALLSDAADPVVSSILELLRAEPDVATMPAAYNDPARVFTGAPDYPARRYIFGLVICPECHNENMYYQDRDALAAGYHFRCRICQHELLATSSPDAPD